MNRLLHEMMDSTLYDILMFVGRVLFGCCLLLVLAHGVPHVLEEIQAGEWRRAQQKYLLEYKYGCHLENNDYVGCREPKEKP